MIVAIELASPARWVSIAQYYSTYGTGQARVVSARRARRPPQSKSKGVALAARMALLSANERRTLSKSRVREYRT